MIRKCIVFYFLALLPLTMNCSNSPTLAERLGYTDKDILVIVNSDDIGMHKDLTDGTCAAMDFGLCKSASIMVPCPDFERTVALCKNNSNYSLGIHLTLTSEWKNYRWTPVLSKEKVPSLYDPEGYMWPHIGLVIKKGNIQEIEMELEAQVKKILASGVQPTHINGHHSCLRSSNDIFSIAIKLSKKYNLPLRPLRQKRYKTPFFPNNIIKLRRMGYIFPNTSKGFYMIEDEENNPHLRKKYYLDYLSSLKPGVHEILTHAAYVTDELDNIIHRSFIRTGDTDFWTSQETKDYAEKLGIIFIDFSGLQKLQEKNPVK